MYARLQRPTCEEIDDMLTAACSAPMCEWRSHLPRLAAALDHLADASCALLFQPSPSVPFLSFLTDRFPRCVYSPIPARVNAALTTETTPCALPWRWNEGRAPSLCWCFVPLRAGMPRVEWLQLLDVTDADITDFHNRAMCGQRDEERYPVLVDLPDKPASEHTFQCVACQEAVAVVMLNPCHHVAFCATCWGTMARAESAAGAISRCPVCRACVISSLHVHLM